MHRLQDGSRPQEKKTCQAGKRPSSYAGPQRTKLSGWYPSKTWHPSRPFDLAHWRTTSVALRHVQHDDGNGCAFFGAARQMFQQLCDVDIDMILVWYWIDMWGNTLTILVLLVAKHQRWGWPQARPCAKIITIISKVYLATQTIGSFRTICGPTVIFLAPQLLVSTCFKPSQDLSYTLVRLDHHPD